MLVQVHTGTYIDIDHIHIDNSKVMLTSDLCVLVQFHTCTYKDIDHTHTDNSTVKFGL